MISRLLIALAPALIWTLGGLALQSLLPAPLERSRAARLALGFLLGAAGAAWTVWSASFVFAVPLSALLFLAFPLAAVLAAIAVGFRRRSWGGLAPVSLRRGAPRRELLVIAVLLAAAVGALLLNGLVEPVIDFDGRMTWGTAAKYLHAERSVLPAVHTDAGFYLIHPRYPILLPLLQAGAVMLGSGEIEGAGVRPFYVLFLPALLLVLTPTLMRRGGRWPATLVLLLLASAPGLLWEREIGARGTFSDLPLGAFLCAALVVLLHPRLPLEPWRGWLAGLLLAAVAGAKNEGLILAPATALAVAWDWRRHRPEDWPRVRATLRRALLSALLAGALVQLWAQRIPNRNDEAYFAGLSIRAALAGLSERIGDLIVRVGAQAFDFERSGLIFWLLPLVLLGGGRALRGRLVTAAAALLAVELTFVTYAYAVVGNLDVVDVTWPRFVLQLYAPLAIVLTVAARGTWTAARRPR